MASVIEHRQKTSASRFSWLSKLYKRNTIHGHTARSNRNVSSQPSTPGSSVHGAPFLSLQQSGNSQDTFSSDASSLWPTISTRAPSVSSNAAVLNVEAPASLAGHRNSRADSTLSLKGDASKDSAREADESGTLQSAKQRTIDTQSRDEGPDDDEMIDTPRIGMDEHAEDENSLPSPRASMHSSKESPIPSIFTTRTMETQPTQFHHTPASLLSQRTGGNMGAGAADNASILTLASSSKARRRRRSIDTQASMLALAPASARTSFDSSHTQPASFTSPLAGLGDTSALGGRTNTGTGTSLAGSLHNYRSILPSNNEERDLERLSADQRSASGYSLQSMDAHPPHGGSAVALAPPILSLQPEAVEDD